MQNEQIILILRICGWCAFFPALLCSICGVFSLIHWRQSSEDPAMVAEQHEPKKQPRRKLLGKKPDQELAEEEHIPVAEAILSEEAQYALAELLEFMPITPGWQHLYVKEQAR